MKAQYKASGNVLIGSNYVVVHCRQVQQRYRRYENLTKIVRDRRPLQATVREATGKWQSTLLH